MVYYCYCYYFSFSRNGPLLLKTECTWSKWALLQNLTEIAQGELFETKIFPPEGITHSNVTVSFLYL